MSIKLYKTLDEQLYKWYLEQKTLGITITDELLHQEAYKIIKTVRGPSNMCKFLQQFKKRNDIVLEYISGCIKYNRLDEQLYEWCQEQQASGDTITKKLFRQKAYEISKQVGEKPLDMYSFLRQFEKRYDIVLQSRNTTEILQNPVHRDEVNQSDAEKFIQELNQQLEKENISRENIYIMIKTEVKWKTVLQVLLAYVDETKITMQQIDDLKKNIITTNFIFCTNVTGSHKLSPVVNEFVWLVNEYENQGVSEHCESKLPVAHKLQENASTKESKDIITWYNYVFKTSVKNHQKKKNITGKVLLFVDNCIQRILPEEITQDNYAFELLPITKVPFFEQLYPEMIKNIDQVFYTYILECLQNFSFEGKEFNIDWHMYLCKNIICQSWEDIAMEDIEKLWRKFLRQYCQTREGIPTLTFAVYKS